MTKNALIALVVICMTMLSFSLLVRDRLCSISLSSGSTTVKLMLYYEES